MPLSFSLPIHGTREQIVRVGSRSFRLSFWPLQLGGWLLYGCVASILVLTRFLEPSTALWFALLRPATGLFFSTLIRPICRKLAGHECHPIAFIAGAGLASLVLATVDYGVSEWILLRAGLISSPIENSTMAIGVFLLRWISMGAWIALYFGLKQGQFSAIVDQANRESELFLLQAQVHPHFLFNALNSIMAEANEPEKVRFLTLSLAQYLRFSLRQKRFLYPFGEEVHALKGYVGIQQIRFMDKLECRFEIGPGALEHMVPSSVAQPLLENALKYGYQTSPTPLRILFSASVSKENLLVVCIQNSGHWVPPEPSSSGTGLANLRRRLELIYGSRAKFSIDSIEGAMVASITLPFKASA